MRVALVGTAPSSRLLAPYSDPDVKIWACSPGNMGCLPRADEWFELHDMADLAANVTGNDKYLAWLRKRARMDEGKPTLWVQAETPLLPNGTALPKDELLTRFGRYFFTSSIAWMMAFAMHRGATEIGIYGVDMQATDEYGTQRPALHHFIWLAESWGVKVQIPIQSCLHRPPPLYAYDMASPMGAKLAVREAEIKNNISAMEKQLATLNERMAHFNGALEDIEYMKRTWVDG